MKKGSKTKNSAAKLEKELRAVEKIIETVYRSAKEGGFNFHLIKNKENGSESLNERKLSVLDTKRILEVAQVLEKAVAIKKKILEETRENETEKDDNSSGIIILPPVKEFEKSLFDEEGGEDIEIV